MAVDLRPPSSAGQPVRDDGASHRRKTSRNTVGAGGTQQVSVVRIRIDDVVVLAHETERVAHVAVLQLKSVSVC